MAEASPTSLTPVTPPAVSSRNRLRSVGVLVVLVIAVGVLLSQGLLHSLNYFLTVDEALAQKATLGARTIRLEGVVKPGTIHRTNQGARFVVTGSGASVIAVHVSGTPPQLFQANIPVVVVGHFVSKNSTLFVGWQIMVKHTATYIAAHPARVRAPNGTVR